MTSSGESASHIRPDMVEEARRVAEEADQIPAVLVEELVVLEEVLAALR
jgi:hypothetical protein